MRRFGCIWLGLWVCGLLAGAVRAETFHLTDGDVLSGEIVSYNDSGLIVRQADDKYSDRVSWTRFSQEDLRRLAQNSKIAPLVEPFIEVLPEEKPKVVVEIRTPPRLKRPETRSLLGAMFSSGVGLVVLLLVYAANIYAAHEISICRGRPVLLTCGVSALMPVLGPILFLVMPAPAKRRKAGEEGEQAPEAAQPTPGFPVPQSPSTPRTYASPLAPASAPQPTAATAAPVAESGGLRLHQEEAAASKPALPQTQVFQRGAFTFNRRFFETRFPGFFGIVRRDAEKDLLLLINSARGDYIVHRITRITANEFHVEVQKGAASEELMIPFTEIKEVILKHKDA